MNTQTLVAVLIAILGSGVVTAVVNAWFSRKKNSAETGRILIEDAINLERLAAERFTETKARLDLMEELFAQVKLDLERAGAYIIVLEDVLKMNGIPVPEKEGN